MTALRPGQSPPPVSIPTRMQSSVVIGARAPCALDAIGSVRALMAVVIAIDAGTTGVRAVAVDEDGVRGRVRPTASSPSTSPGPGWVEHDAVEIWDAVQRHAGRARRRARRADRRHRHHRPARDRVAWDRAHRPARCTAPSCGRTAAPPTRCDELARRRAPAARAGRHRPRARPVLLGHQARVAAAPRAASTPDADLAFGTVDAWLLWNLTGGRRGVHATEPSNASRTMLLRHPRRSRGRAELCDLFGVPASRPARGAAVERPLRHDRRRLPAARRHPGAAASPATSRPRCSARPASTPGMTKNTYGTGSFVLMNVGDRLPRAGRGPAHHRRRGTLGRRHRAPTRSRAPSSSPAPPSSGCATASGIIERRRRDRAAGRVGAPTPTAWSSCPRSPASAARGGTRTPAAPSSASPAAPAGPTSPAPSSRRWRSRPATSSTP